MKEISKKDLLVQLQEQSDVDEMAYNPKGTQDTSGKVVAFRPIFKDGNTSEIPDGFQLNKINTTEDPNTGKKKKELVEEVSELLFDDVKETRIVVSFK